MKKAIVALGLILVPCCCVGQTNSDVGLAIPVSTGIVESFWQGQVLEEPLHGFFGMFNSRADHNADSRFNSLWYLNLLRKEEVGEPFWDSAASNLRSILKKSGKETLREYFLVDDGLPFLGDLKDRVEVLFLGDQAEKFMNFFSRTLSGKEERDQISSPFHSEEGVPIRDYGSFRNKVSFGVRPFNVNNPYVFLGYSLKVDNERILTLQNRLYFKDWERLTGEFLLEVPVREYSIGGGLRMESREWWYRDKREDKDHLFSFLGVRGPCPIFGGEFFIGTGFPETLTAYYNRRF